MRPIITLTTDFGASDSYVAQMKGVILSINRDAVLVDVTHAIPPQDVARAATVVAEMYNRFPVQTIHLVVVDPGVGSERAPVAVEAGEHRFVAPDNGVLANIVERNQTARVVELTNDRIWQQPVSNTFHGRDLFAPAAAHLSLGLDLSELGPTRKGPLSVLDAPRPTRSGDALVGEIMWADAFGNLITNIDESHLPADKRDQCFVEVGAHRIECIHRYYAEVSQGELLALIGSGGRLEIAVRGGSAAELLNCRTGPVIVGVGDFVHATDKAEPP